MRLISNFYSLLQISLVSPRTYFPHFLNSQVQHNPIKSFVRNKFVQNIGIKGLRNKKSLFESRTKDFIEDDQYEGEPDVNLDDREYDALASSTMHITNTISYNENVLIIQPYIKWGPHKTVIKPELMLEEAEALIRSIPDWNIVHSLKIPLESLEKKQLFGKGKTEELKALIKDFYLKGKKITRIFLSKGTLSFIQKRWLELEFQIDVMDRYSIVIQILRLHATSAEAKLQVAMAEIPYIWAQMKDSNPSLSRKQGYSLADSQKEILQAREKKLKQKLQNIRMQRKNLRKKRQKQKFPIIAVVGYTNAGKTALIKALTNEITMEPKDQLFATLDVTAHAGILPCKLKVIYMDTVGFMSDIPTGLIECFIATLEDAMLADIIIHIQDLANENYLEQKKHVETTLKSLMYNADPNYNGFHPDKIINVGNKIDLVSNLETIENRSKLKLISSKTLAGIHDLMIEIEKKILQSSERKKIIFRIDNGSNEMAWLYKNATVINIIDDNEDKQKILLTTIITEENLQKFRHNFVKKEK